MASASAYLPLITHAIRKRRLRSKKLKKSDGSLYMSGPGLKLPSWDEHHVQHCLAWFRFHGSIQSASRGPQSPFRSLPRVRPFPPPIFKVSLEMTNSTTLKCLWREHPTQLASSKHIAIITKLSQMAAFKKKKVLKAKGTAERESKVCQKVIGRKPLFSGGWGEVRGAGRSQEMSRNRIRADLYSISRHLY